MTRPLLALLVGAVVVPLLLTGCTGSPDQEPSASPSSPPVGASTAPPMPTPSATPTSVAEARYVTAVQQLSSTLAPVDPSVLVALGHDVCRSFAAGRSVSQIAEAFGSAGGITGFSGSDAAVIIGAAVPTLCPQYRDRLE